MSTTAAPHAVRVALPAHLRRLADAGAEVTVQVDGTPTVAAVLDVLEREHPALRGTIREHGSSDRRAFMRYYACGEDISQRPPTDPLPSPVAAGTEPLRIVGAIAGG